MWKTSSATAIGSSIKNAFRKGVFRIRNSKGFSLVELIVVAAIIGICIGLASLSVSVVFSSLAMKCSNSINAELSKCRINAMSRAADVYLRLYCDADGNVIADYCEGGAVVSSEEVGGSRVTVTFETDTEHTLSYSGGVDLCLTFRRDSGALVTLKSDGSDAEYQCTKITVSGGGRSYIITLVPATGAHTVGA